MSIYSLYILSLQRDSVCLCMCMCVCVYVHRDLEVPDCVSVKEGSSQYMFEFGCWVFFSSFLIPTFLGTQSVHNIFPVLDRLWVGSLSSWESSILLNQSLKLLKNHTGSFHLCFRGRASFSWVDAASERAFSHYSITIPFCRLWRATVRKASSWDSH